MQHQEEQLNGRLEEGTWGACETPLPYPTSWLDAPPSPSALEAELRAAGPTMGVVFDPPTGRVLERVCLAAVELSA